MGPSTNDDEDDDDDNPMGTTKTSSTPSLMILQGETFFETNEDDQLDLLVCFDRGLDLLRESWIMLEI